jgi:hypothetical protein
MHSSVAKAIRRPIKGLAELLKQYDSYVGSMEVEENIWGLIYKTVRGIVTKDVRTPRSQVLCAPKNIPIYKTLRTHTGRNLYKSQSAYKCAQLNQLHVPPCTRPFLTINGQCK